MAFVTIVSSPIRDHIPREYPRKTRSLKFVDRMKATEHGLFHSCVGPVDLFDILPPRLYNNFLVFHVAITILSSEEFCYSQNQYAHQLLLFFLRKPKKFMALNFCRTTYTVLFIFSMMFCATVRCHIFLHFLSKTICKP